MQCVGPRGNLIRPTRTRSVVAAAADQLTGSRRRRRRRREKCMENKVNIFGRICFFHGATVKVVVEQYGRKEPDADRYD